ncbi:MAG: AbrB/MazE/SpoVT family DNA-binding domain-containing protein [Rhodospirillales bacterium]|nr:AbrB/MazE/SpoVT family DNA-binding domain-containing protein [Rhodospirillales bacterium]
MKTSLTKIGNSKGVIIPAHILKQFAFEDEVVLKIENKGLLITKPAAPRAGWAEAFIAAGPDEDVFGPDIQNSFDDEDWTW